MHETERRFSGYEPVIFIRSSSGNFSRISAGKRS
jgi:hypothetical protein